MTVTPQTTTIFTSRDGAIHKTAKEAAGVNLSKSLLELRREGKFVLTEVSKQKGEKVDVLMELVELMILSTWLTEKTSIIEGLLNDYIEDCRAGKKVTTP